jgi:hypothetical protein
MLILEFQGLKLVHPSQKERLTDVCKVIKDYNVIFLARNFGLRIVSSVLPQTKFPAYHENHINPHIISTKSALNMPYQGNVSTSSRHFPAALRMDALHQQCNTNTICG